MYEEVKASVVFMCALSAQPVTKFEDIITVKTNSGLFLPAVAAKAFYDQNRESNIYFPIFCVDALNGDKLEEVREAFHKKIDDAFDAHKAMWEESAKKKDLPKES